MGTARNALTTTVAVLLLLAGVSRGAQGFVPGGAGSFGEAIRRPLQLRGLVVCAKCTLTAVRKAQPHEHALYELTHRQGQVVLNDSMARQIVNFRRDR
jgi:hypothetical protein